MNGLSFLSGVAVGLAVMAVPVLWPPAEPKAPPTGVNRAEFARVARQSYDTRTALLAAEADVARLLVTVTELRARLDEARRLGCGGPGAGGGVEVNPADRIPPTNLPER